MVNGADVSNVQRDTITRRAKPSLVPSRTQIFSRGFAPHPKETSYRKFHSSKMCPIENKCDLRDVVMVMDCLPCALYGRVRVQQLFLLYQGKVQAHPGYRLRGADGKDTG